MEVVSQRRNANKNVQIVRSLSTGLGQRKFVLSVLITQQSGHHSLTLHDDGAYSRIYKDLILQFALSVTRLVRDWNWMAHGFVLS